MQYRREIDGLRAIAVMSVILFHAGFNSFSGGFVGVDIFFVISGFLITSIILKEKEQDRFSLIFFYERRARRIIPTLFLVVLCSFIAAWFYLIPADMENFSQSLVAVSFFSSNILFWLESGYWGSANELKPLLHTWSLAVEEQYYIFFPLLVMALWRFKNTYLLYVFGAITAVSFFLSVWGAYNYPVFTFFSPITRAWEFAVGASIAFIVLYKNDLYLKLNENLIVSNIFSAIGLILLFYSIYFFNNTISFPGVNALVPTIGSGLIIFFSNPKTITGQILSHRLLVGIGLVSYSAYLWHQPLFAFTKHTSVHEITTEYYLLLIALTFILAFLSWKYFENPFRNKRIVSPRFIMGGTIAVTVLMASVGLTGHMNQGFGDRSLASGVSYAALGKNLEVQLGLHRECTAQFMLSEHCQTNDNPEILIWGDSFAMHLVKGIIASNPNASIIQMTKGMCGPFTNIAPYRLPLFPERWGKSCIEFNSKVLDWLNNSNVKYVVLSSPFSHYLSEPVITKSGKLIPANMDFIIEEFNATLSLIRSMDKIPVIFSPLPSTGHSIGRCLIKAEIMGISKSRCNFNSQDRTELDKLVFEFLSKISEKDNLVRLDTYLCDDAHCLATIAGVSIYGHSTHLTEQGSELIGKDVNFFNLIINSK